MKSLIRMAALLGVICLSVPAAVTVPVNPNASAAAQQLYTYLQNLSGQGILSGQLSMLNDSIQVTDTLVTSFRDRYVMQRDGDRLPALYASNFGDWPMDYQDSIIRTIKARWKATGGKTAFMLCWHAVQPDTNESLGYSAMSRFSSSDPYPSQKIDSILTPGTALNTVWMKRLKVAGRYLQELDSAGIPVLWRPFHENNGAFFWWGQQPRFKELWKQMYDYYTDTLKLNNLLWVYSMCWFGEGDRWIDSLYPGEKYVDVLGVDIYKGSYGQDYSPWIYQTLLSKAGGKPIGITENGTMPYIPTLKRTQPKWSFFATWWGYEVDTLWANAYYHPAGYTIQNPDSLYTANYGDSYTITADEINWNLAADTHVFLSTAVSPTGSGTITAAPDSAGRYPAGTAVSLTPVPKEGWDFVKWTGDTSGAAAPLSLTLTKDLSVTAVFSARKGTNLLLNGDFSDSLNGWSYSAWETGTTATATVGADSALVSTVTARSSHDYGIQLTQGLLLDSGVTYQFSADIKGERNAAIGYAIGESSGQYRKLLSGADTLTGTAVTTVVDTFTDTLPSASALRVEFEMGAQLGSLTLDNIKVARISGSDIPQAIAPHVAGTAALTITRQGRGFTWTRAATSNRALLRILDAQGRCLARQEIASGVTSGRLPEFSGSGLYRVILESSGARETALLPALR